MNVFNSLVLCAPMRTALRIFLIEDDLLSRMALELKLKNMGHSVVVASSGEEAKIKARAMKFDLAFVDLDLDRPLEGLKVLPILKDKNIYSIVLSAHESDDVIKACYLKGGDDYLAKPINDDELKKSLFRINQENVAKKVSDELREKLFITTDILNEEIELISQSILSTRPILITGETGTGKTFLAKLIHQLSEQQGPFIQVNCSEFTETLLESELFGHEKGAFTGAIKNKKGLLELADNGYLFLDEISTMSISLQKKLLKAIEEKEFYPVGGEKKIKSNFRLISATCEDLHNKIATGEFREDLYFRIEGFNLTLKPLRERKGDISLIVKSFVKKESRRFILSDNAFESLLNYSFPGNIRELEKIVEILRAKNKGIIEANDLKNVVQEKKSKVRAEFIDIEEVKSIGLSSFIEKIEMKVLEDVLHSNDKKVRKTLNDLKLSNNSYYRILGNLNKNQEQLNER